MKNKNAKVGIVMGSNSDLEVMKESANVLDKYGISYTITVTSAHRTPARTTAFAKNAEKSGIEIIIAGAGFSAALPGVIASHTILPVIGVPLASSPLNGVDALYSIVQMPSGIPVACMGVGKSGAANAGHLAAEILGMKYLWIKQRIKKIRLALAKKK
ncbi:MAG: 5-(carboxyamino)imidazole ribonucleotide mutase [Candidatus Firestonebacteria bacterium]